MNPIKILFFGSTSDSLIVLKHIHNLQLTTDNIHLVAVITQPPRPIGRKQIITPTPTEVWAKEHNISVLSFANAKETAFMYEDEAAVINTLETFKADLLISASYGEKIPTKTITDARFGGLNVHPSLLPRWRGPDPLPWTILAGDHQTGVTVVTITDHMDEGKIIAQKKIPVTLDSQREDLRKELFTMGAELLVSTLPEYISGSNQGQPQDPEKIKTARRLKREDGYIPWSVIQKAMKGDAISREEFPIFFQQFIEPTTNNPLPLSGGQLIVNALRALSPWPGLWSEINVPKSGINNASEHQSVKKRLKILKAHLSSEKPISLSSHPSICLVLDEVQIEGKNPTSFALLQDAYPLL